MRSPFLKFLLGCFLLLSFLGPGSNPLSAESFQEVKLSAEKGNPDAQKKMGDFFCTGVVVIQNFIEAAKWYRKAAVQGNIKAQYLLGVMYRGHGIPRNLPEAVGWITKAAEAGDREAQVSLGIMHASGEGIDKNDRKAFQMFEKAALQGNPEAIFNLGFFYSKSHLFCFDLVKAFAWFKLAFERASGPLKERAGKHLNRTQRLMKPDEMTKSEDLYNELQKQVPAD